MIYLFDWGNTIMKVFPDETGPMYLWKKVEIMPGADEMLRKLNETADCYIATNAKDSEKEDIIKALKRVGIDSYFKDIFCFREIGFPKPSKEYFEDILKRLETEKEHITMVGDHLENDICGALEFGFTGILYDPDDSYPTYSGKKIKTLITLSANI